MSRIRRYFFPKQLHADPQVRIGTIRTSFPRCHVQISIRSGKCLHRFISSWTLPTLTETTKHYINGLILIFKCFNKPNNMVGKTE